MKGDAEADTEADADSITFQGKASFLQEHVSALAHLATFGIIGVLVRFGLEKLFGPSLARVTDFGSALFIDLPANMLGCFFMGWVGIVLKSQLADVSEHLALGLSTGLMGSITTFASWSQSMVKIITAGYWIRGLCGFLLGMELSVMSLLVGIDTASLALQCFRSVFRSDIDMIDQRKTKITTTARTREGSDRSSVLLFMFLSVGLWVMAFALLFREKSYERKKLWIACTLAPLGVWSRWWISRLNGKGVRGYCAWLPTGTLSANVSASFLEFVLNILELLQVIRNQQLLIVSAGFQFGLLGCMSTVSTLTTELYLLHQEQPKLRCYAYACVSILVTLTVGLVSFSAAAWMTGVAVHV